MPRPQMTLTEFAVECFWPDGHQSDLIAAAARATKSAAALSARGHVIRYVESIQFVADEIVFSLFQAESSGLVRDVSRSAALPFERVLECRRIAASPKQALTR